MSKIKVLHVIPIDDDHGAAQQVLALHYSNDSEFTMEVLLPEGSQLHSLLKNDAIQCVTYTNDSSIKKSIKKINPDIIHTHTSHTGRVAAYKAGRYKRVHSQHKITTAGFFEKLKINSLSDITIATTKAIHQSLLQQGTAKVRLIYNGVEPAWEYEQDDRNQLLEQCEISQGSFVATCIAKRTSDLDYVLDTARELPYNVVVLIAGDLKHANGHESHLQRRIKNERLSNVRLLESAQELDELISITNVQVILPHTTQDSLAPLLMGISAGKPAIFTDFDPFVVADGINGIAVSPSDPQQLDDAITRLKDDPKMYKELSQNAKQIYKERFTAEKMADEIKNIYRKL